MTQPNNNVSMIVGAVLLLAVLAGVFVLAWHRTVSGGEALTVVTAIVGIAGGGFAMHAGVKAGSDASSPSTPVVTSPTHPRLPE